MLPRMLQWLNLLANCSIRACKALLRSWLEYFLWLKLYFQYLSSCLLSKVKR